MDLTNFYNLNPTELNAAIILFNLLFAFVLQLLIVYTYKKTRHGLSYSQSFIFTMIIVGVLSASIMMAVQNNIIGAFAIFAAFTMIRFRSILKEPSDLAYLFYSLVVGISIGMSHYSLGLVTVVVLSSIIYLFYRFGFGTVSDNFDFVMLLSAKDGFKLSTINDKLDNMIAHRELLHSKHLGNDLNEYSLSIRLKEGVQAETVTEELQGNKHITRIELLTGKSTSEF